MLSGTIIIFCGLKSLGFNTVQLNIAWGCRPADEPLNLEDVTELKHSSVKYRFEGLLPYRADNSPRRRDQRKDQLRHRILLSKQTGMRTLFHFGAPNNVCYSLGRTIDNKMPLCLSDPNCTNYYLDLLTEFTAEYPGVDDILVYTYDQDAWLCNEFGDCPACRGIPVHKRVAPFINALGKKWKTLTHGRLWWEPWELSAGQVLKSIELLDPASVGLMLHSNIAEVQVTMPVDRWFKNACALAEQRGIEVCAECYLGAPSEEVEPFQYLSFPQVTLRQVKEINAVAGVCGIKEYFGIIPTKFDANLEMTSLFFANQGVDEEQAVNKLAEYYGSACGDVKRFWEKCSQAMELFPWDTSWFIRQIGRSDPGHSMSAAFIRGQQCHTPSWFSTRSAVFMKTDSVQPDPWMLEDVGLRCEMAADRMSEAIQIGYGALPRIPEHLRADFSRGLGEWEGFRKRARAYVYHLRETNLAELMRAYRRENKAVPQSVIDEMHVVIQSDIENQNGHKELQAAMRQLHEDIDVFLDRYFEIGNKDTISKGYFSLTSR